MNMHPFFQKHGIGLLFAILVGIVLVVPMVLIPVSVGEKYQGVQYLPLDDEDIYRARINEVLEGHLFITSPFFYEYKDFPLVVPPFNEWLYVLLALCIGLSWSIVVLKFLLPASLFFLVYLLVYRLTKRSDGTDDIDAVLIASLSTGLLVTLGFEFVHYKYIWNVLHGGVANPIIWSRIVNPIVGAVQLFGFLVLLEAINSRRFKYAYLYAGVLLSITIGYFFTLGMSLAILGSLLLTVVWRKEWVIARELVYVGVIGFVLSIWYWIKIFSSISGTEGSLVGLRNGMSFTHTPVLNLALLAGTLFVVLSAIIVYFRHRMFPYPKSWNFVFALILGSWVAFNQQIITGREVWYGHFFQYSVPLVYVALGVIAYHSWRLLYPRIWLWCSVGIMIITSLYGLFTISQVLSRETEFARIQEYAPVFTWLNNNTGKECVVFIKEYDEEFERLIPAYTHCDVYSSTWTFSGVPSERVLHNYLLRLRLSGLQAEDAHAYLMHDVEKVRGYFYMDWKQMFSYEVDDWYIEKVNYLENEYTKFLQGDLQDQMSIYRMDFLMSKDPVLEGTIEGLPHLYFIKRIGNYYVYSQKETNF
jgi:hypothetical protein